MMGFVRSVGLEIWLLASRRLTWLLGALLLAAMLFAAHGGGQRVRAVEGEIAQARAEAARAEQEARAAAQAVRHAAIPPEQYRDPTDPYGYLFYFMRAAAFRSPAPLAAIATGDGDLRPSVIRIAPGPAFAEGVGGAANPRLARIGRFDLAFVLVYLVPLALIAGIGGTIAEDREAGIIQLLTAQGATLTRIVLARFVAAALVAVPVLVLGFWLSLWLAGALARGGVHDAFRLGGGLMLYALFWLALATVIATRSATAAASQMALVATWLVLLFLVPAIGDEWIAIVAPPPSRIAAIDAARAEMATFDADPVDRTRRWLHKRGLAGTPAEARRPDLQRLASDDLLITTMAPYRRAQRSYLAVRQAWQARLSWLSPGLLYQRRLVEASGTDPARFARFATDADDRAIAIERRFVPAIVHRAVQANGQRPDPK